MFFFTNVIDASVKLIFMVHILTVLDLQISLTSVFFYTYLCILKTPLMDVYLLTTFFNKTIFLYAIILSIVNYNWLVFKYHMYFFSQIYDLFILIKYTFTQIEFRILLNMILIKYYSNKISCNV